VPARTARALPPRSALLLERLPTARLQAEVETVSVEIVLPLNGADVPVRLDDDDDDADVAVPDAVANSRPGLPAFDPGRGA
jgi:hypothetical protein